MYWKSAWWLPIMLAGVLALAACGVDDTENAAGGRDSEEPLNVVTTTTMIRDAVENVAGDLVSVESLMGPGVDPHSYRARESDVARMENADVIFYNGLHLEGAMSEVLERMQDRTRTVAIAERIDEDRLIAPDEAIFGEDFAGQYDPHIWFDVDLWALAIEVIRDELVDLDPDNAVAYEQNADNYLAELEDLDEYVRNRIAELPEHQRVLVTAHDAFGYLGNAYGVDVYGLQPLTTVVEAGAADVRDLADLIIEREIRAIFLETAVPPQGIEAVREAVRARDFDVEIGGELYGDALGEHGTEQGTYIGAFRHNADTIVDALLGESIHSNADDSGDDDGGGLYN
jgi:manganese/zinc/iron transport system substrate-binding protein